jgi:hypothetical protein
MAWKKLNDLRAAGYWLSDEFQDVLEDEALNLTDIHQEKVICMPPSIHLKIDT